VKDLLGSIMRNKRLWFLAAIICLVSISVYLLALENDFVNWDDIDYVYENPYLRVPVSDYMVWAFSTSRTGNWHPLTWLSLRADYALWGLNPMGYHLSSVLFHGLNTLLVVLLAGVLLKRGLPSQKGAVLFGAAVVGILFGLHPIHVESVAWISERKDVLYALFWLLSLLAYTGYISSEILKRKVAFYVLCFISFALSLISKPMAVTLPLVLLILDYYPFRRLSEKSRYRKVVLLEKLPFYLLSVVVSVVTFLVQKGGGAMSVMGHLSLWKRSVGAVKALGFYLAKTVWPVNLVPFYPLDPQISLLTWENMLSLIVILSITAVSVKLWRRVPLLIAVWCYYLITLLPVLGIVQVGSQAAADRYMYLPIFGTLMIIGGVGAIAWERGKNVRYIFIALFLFYAAFISVATAKQIPVWKDSITLWEYVISKEPGAAVARNNLGAAYENAGRFNDAIREYVNAAQIAPDFMNPYNAIEDLFRQINPGNDAETHNNRGIIYASIGRTDNAVKEFQAAIRINPDSVMVHNNLGIMYARQGRTEDAVKEFLMEIRINPDFYSAHYNLGVAYKMEGRLDEAVKEFQTALRLKPDHAGARKNLESILQIKK
jgi:tetratricopeptide (TPR) repeat protein